MEKTKEKKASKKEVVKPIVKKPKYPTKKYTLIKDDVVIRGKKHKIGDKVDLTEEGRRYFKQKFYIK